MRKILFLSPVVLFLASILIANMAQGQGVLVDLREDHSFRIPRHHHPHWPRPPHPRPIPRPQPPTSYKIEKLGVDVRLSGQLAQVQVSQTFVNTSKQTMQVSFVFPLPYDGAVDRLTFMVDGKEYEAKLLAAAEARKIYESYVRRNQDPALMEWIGTGMFKTSVFPVPAGAKRTVTLRYSQVCRTFSGSTEFLFPLSTAQYTSEPVESIELNVAIDGKAKIKNVYCPNYTVEIKRPDDNRATVSCKLKKKIPTSDFRLFYDTGNSKVGASVLSYRPSEKEDGYYMMLVSPDVKQENDEIVKKSVIFVVDRSGSMSGKKIEQARDALRTVLNNLREGDLFNVIAYDREVEVFEPELQKYNEKSRRKAMAFVDGIYAGGSTNIESALNTALAQLKDTRRPNYVLFLTDGLPTAGETNEMKIVESAKKTNKVNARVFTFGVGFDVNSRLLDKLARDCRGVSEYVRPDEDIEDSVSKLYTRIGSPVMTDVVVGWDADGKAPGINRTYPKKVYDLFAGDQLVMVGRYRTPCKAKVTISGRVGSDPQKLDFPARLVKDNKGSKFAFISKLWAMRRIGEIIDEIDLNGKNSELVKELVELSKKHGIITPYTSFLADDTVATPAKEAMANTAGRRLEMLESEASGENAFALRKSKGQMSRATGAARPGSVAPADDASSSGPMGPIAGAGGGSFYYDADKKRDVQVNTVRTIAGKTFYLRKGRWIDSTLTPEEVTSATKVKRYSREYFDIAGKDNRTAAKYMVIEEPFVIKLDGKVYEF